MHTRVHVCVCNILLTHPSIYGHMVYFHNLVIIATAAVNIGVFVSPCISIFVFFG